MHHTHPRAEAKAVEMADLADEDFVMFPRSTVARLYDHIAGLCWNAGFRPKVVQEAVQFATLLGLVSGNVGIAIVPDPLRLLTLPGVRFVAISDERATSQVSLATPLRPTDLARVAVDLVVDEFKKAAQ